MQSPDAKKFVEGFFSHPNPLIYTHHPEVPELCSVVIPASNGVFNNKSPRMGLASFLLEAQKLRDVRDLWHSWGPEGLWNPTHRQQLVDALDKPLKLLIDCPTIKPELFPEDLKDPRFIKLDIRRVPLIFIPWLQGPIWNFFIPQDSVIVFSLEVPMRPTKMRLQDLGLEYARR